MREIFWLRPNRIAGRCGPAMAPWDASALAAAGIGAILSVNDAASVYPDELAAAGIDHAHYPMEDNAPPRDGDFDTALAVLTRAQAFIEASLRRERAVLIHCTAGKDRTGLTMAHYLCRSEAYAPGDAIAEVRRVRPQGLSATGYEAFALEVLAALARERSGR